MTDIWLDTSIVLNWNPRLDSVTARNFLKYARDFDHRVFLNQIVLRELTKQYVDRAAEWIEDHKKLSNDIARLALPVSLVVEGALPTHLDEFYRNLLIKRCKEESITITPFHPELEGELIQRLLQMAIQHQPPFDGKKSRARAFKDVLIVLSILEYARQHGENQVIFLAEDNDFKRESITALSNQYGVKLNIFQSVPEFTAHLDQLASMKIRKQKQKERKRVHSFLVSQKDQISLFIRNNFDTAWLSHYALIAGASYDIKGVWLEEIPIFAFTSELSEHDGITTLFITFEVIANIRFGSRRIWVDGETESYAILDFEPVTVHGFGGPGLDRQEKIRLDCEATAEEDAAGEFINFQMKSVRLKVTITPATGTLTLEGQQGHVV